MDPRPPALYLPACMKSILNRLKDGRTLVSDGAWGTFLQKQGLQPGECPELWCVEHREKVLAIAASYVEAGSDIILTNSFGCTSFKLEHFGLADRAAELNEAAASISREAAGDDVMVAGSIGPTGKLLLMGDVTAEELYDAFKVQALGLERGGADACCIETFAAIDEAELAIKAVRENTALEAICTFTFERTVNDDYRTMMGTAPGEAAQACAAAGAHVVGTNCGNGMERMVDIVKAIRETDATTPILVHGNAGMPVNIDGVDTFPESPEDMAANVLKVVAAGANIVGGCCGTTPDHIRAIKAAVADLQSNSAKI